jgi:hypothetical protein
VRRESCSEAGADLSTWIQSAALENVARPVVCGWPERCLTARQSAAGRALAGLSAALTCWAARSRSAHEDPRLQIQIAVFVLFGPAGLPTLWAAPCAHET